MSVRLAALRKEFAHLIAAACGFLAFLVYLVPIGATASPLPAPSPWLQGWPMVGHDPQRTARSVGTGPLQPNLLLTYAHAQGPPVIGPDGGIYIWGDKGLIALNGSGQVRWSHRAFLLDGGPPALAPDGRLMADAFVKNETSIASSAVLAVQPGGRLAWKVQPAAFSKSVPPLVAPNGMLYVPFVGPTEVNSGLAMITPTGRAQLLQHGFAFLAVALGSDGSIYAVGRYPSHQGFLSVEHVTRTGKLLWSHALGSNGLGLLVGSDGVVYASDGDNIGSDSGSRGVITAYDKRGRRMWRVRTSDGMSTLALAGDGTLLAAGQLGLTAIGIAGKVSWHLPLGRSERDALPSIAVDSAGTIYVGSGDGMVRIIAKDGRQLGSVTAGPPSTATTPAVAIGPNERLVVTGTDGIVRIYGD